jgi:excisionase family DNA binding protein
MNANETIDPLLDAGQVAAILSVSKGTILTLAKTGKFAPAVMVGERRRWKRSVILTWMDANEEKGNEQH